MTPELLHSPFTVHIPGMPQLAVGNSAAAAVSQAPTLAGVGAAWTGACVCGSAYQNNCAHFLSDAFIRAGFTNLNPPNAHIKARCGSKRPIRAREMREWFRSQAVRTSRQLEEGTGWWAVFQLNERRYWGGHVAVFDSDSWTYYGTGWFQDWDQYLYQW